MMGDILDILDFTEFTAISFCMHRRPNKGPRWRDYLDAPISLAEANRLVAEGKLIKATRVLADRTEVVVKMAILPLRRPVCLG